jgi:hypothetical protein
MIRHVLGIVAVVTFFLFCTLLPFLPGPYDSLAVPLSSMAQIAGVLGLGVVPFGLMWIAADRSNRFAQRRYVVSWAALIVSALVWAAVSLVGVIQSGFVLGAIALVLPVYVGLKAWPGLRRANGTTQARASVLPFYLVAVPVTVVLVQFALLERAVEFSRNRAIRNSAPLIEAIEQYRTANGRYPLSLRTVVNDFKPNVIGIREYQYEPHGEGYNLFFEQFTYRFGTQEFVMYNPRDEHVMTVHSIDLLQLTPSQLALDRARGHYALHDAPHPHWKYFWFD